MEFELQNIVEYRKRMWKVAAICEPPNSRFYVYLLVNSEGRTAYAYAIEMAKSEPNPQDNIQTPIPWEYFFIDRDETILWTPVGMKL